MSGSYCKGSNIADEIKKKQLKIATILVDEALIDILMFRLER